MAKRKAERTTQEVQTVEMKEQLLKIKNDCDIFSLAIERHFEGDDKAQLDEAIHKLANSCGEYQLMFAELPY